MNWPAIGIALLMLALVGVITWLGLRVKPREHAGPANGDEQLRRDAEQSRLVQRLGEDDQ